MVRRCFKAEQPNACWLSDVTYIATREGWLYLAAVLDVYSRAIVGRTMSPTLGGQLATDALAMAISQRGVPELVHSDRGSTYATSLYLDLISEHGIHQSMSRQGNWRNNAPMESFFHTLKTELCNALRLQDQGPSTRQPVRLHGSFLQPPAPPPHHQLRGSAS